MVCSIKDCGKPLKARGWCSMHYDRWQRTGTPEQKFSSAQSLSCLGCGTPIAPPKSKWCSDQCRGRKNNTGATSGWSKGTQTAARQICEVCGDPFYAPPVQIRRGGGRFCGNRCKSIYMSSHPETLPGKGGRRGIGGRRLDLDNRYFRSRWEANYARYLNTLLAAGAIASWDYEVESFTFPVKRGCVSYLPDFRVVQMDGSIEFHEVKGYMDQRSQTKLKRMKKYYPDIVLLVIDKDVYEDLSKAVASSIPMWET